MSGTHVVSGPKGVVVPHRGLVHRVRWLLVREKDLPLPLLPLPMPPLPLGWRGPLPWL